MTQVVYCDPLQKGRQPLFYLFVCLGRPTQHAELPCPGIEPMAPTLEERSLYHWTTTEVL